MRRPITDRHGKEGFVDGETTTPQIAVSIGTLARVYHAFVTTAPPALDAPATVTLYAATVSDVAGMAADSDALDAARASAPARLVLVDATELAWQRRRCREARHPLAPADPILVGRNTLQHWLWHRLTAPTEAREGTGADA